MRLPDPTEQPSRDAATAAEAAELARSTAALVLPPSVLDGWSSLCAAEYGLAAHALKARVGDAERLLRAAAVAP